MALEIGTATDAADLWDKLLTFLTSDSALTGAGEEWSDDWSGDGGNEHVLVGPGMSGTDEIYVGMRLHVDTDADEHWIEFRGMTGIISAGEAVEDHINVQPEPVLMFIDNSVMNYWFVANGRRFMIALKISTTFESCYAGFFLPYATPTEYPYPMFIGGTAGPDTGASQSPRSWRESLSGHSAYPWPWADDGINRANTVFPPAYSMTPDGTWMGYSNSNELQEGCIGNVSRGNYLSSDDASPQNDDYYLSNGVFEDGWTDLYGGGKYLMPIHLFECSPGRQTYGVLQGAFRCQAEYVSAEDVITIDAVDYLVVQNIARNDNNDFFAMVLE